MSTVLFKRTDNIDDIPITNGLLLFDTANHKIYMDNGSTRLQYGGDTDLISNVADATVVNTFSAEASLNIFPQKTTVIDTKASALAVTSDHIPLGCKAFKEEIGTTDHSSVGNGTVSDALVKLKGEILTGTLASGATTLTLTSSTLTSNSTLSFFTSNYKVVPKNVTTNTSTKKITLTFSAQSSSTQVKVIVRNL